MNHALLLGVGSDWPVLPLYIVEPEYWLEPDASYRHYQFISECLVELRDDMTRIGQPLIVRVGAARDVLDQLSANFRIHQIFSHEETGNAWTYERDKAVRAWCRERQVLGQKSGKTGFCAVLRTVMAGPATGHSACRLLWLMALTALNLYPTSSRVKSRLRGIWA